MDKREAVSEILDQMRVYVEYWDQQPIGSKEKLDGLAFSILNVIDGTSAGVEPIDLVRDGTVLNDNVMLHEQWYHNEDRLKVHR